MNIPTLEEFSNSRVYVKNIAAVLGSDQENPGFLYPDGNGDFAMSIDEMPEGHEYQWGLSIYNEQYESNDVEELERKLYEWACEEIFVDPDLPEPPQHCCGAMDPEGDGNFCVLPLRHKGSHQDGTGTSWIGGPSEPEYTPTERLAREVAERVGKLVDPTGRGEYLKLALTGEGSRNLHLPVTVKEICMFSLGVFAAANVALNVHQEEDSRIDVCALLEHGGLLTDDMWNSIEGALGATVSSSSTDR